MRSRSVAKTRQPDKGCPENRIPWKNQPRILIGNDARYMDLLQRFRPSTYWTVLARKIEKMAKAGK